MRKRTVLLSSFSLALLALPALADVWSVKLTNGTSFESRYQPRQAAWDPSLVTFLDETGLEVAIPRSMVANIRSLAETKGFGRVINTTTIDMGFAPNDVPEQQRAAAAAGIAAQALPNYTQEQFVEPSEVSGIPLYAAGGGAFATSNPAAPTPGMTVGTPPPFTTTPTGGTPPPFTTTPTTGTPAPFTTTPTGGTPPPFTTTPTTTITTPTTTNPGTPH